MPLTAQQAFNRAEAGGDHVIGWKLDPEQRRELLMQFPPRYSSAVADHVTLASRVAPASELPAETTGEIVGRADDGEGVEAMVVRIGDTSDRPAWLGAARAAHARPAGAVLLASFIQRLRNVRKLVRKATVHHQGCRECAWFVCLGEER